MLHYFHTLLANQGYAPHGYCLLWQPELIWTHVLADAVTALAYFTIPISLVLLVRKRGDIAFSWIFLCFATFILACGATHVLSIVTLWMPIYGVQALVKVLTALVSVVTATALWPLMPRLLAIPSPTQLRLANEALAARIAERDAAIVQLQAEIAERQRAEARLEQSGRELVTAKAAAESASQAKSRFLANMSHELRTPLNAVMGYAQLLMRARGLDPRHVQAGQVIHDSGAHLLLLINDVLDLAKIEAGKFELAAGSIDLRAFFNGICAIIALRAEEKALHFTCSFDDDLPDFVLADEQRLRQVLLNLLGNAVKFTDRGEVALMVHTVPHEGQGLRLRLAVRDTGVGMTPEDLPAIFQPFEQVGEAQRRVGGTGLGLSISRELIALMGGRLEVESTPGHGSLFRFEIDLLAAQAPEPSQDVPADCSGYRGERRHVLVVDDIPANREVLSALLADLGFVVTQAARATAGIEAALAHRPDLIMMDIRLPRMDGLEAMAALRASPDLAGVPIIAVSSGVSEPDRARALAAGALAFLPKPLDRAELIHAVGAATGVEWIARDGSSLAPETARPNPMPVGLAVPPEQALVVLHQAALAGNMRALRNEAERIGAQDPSLAPFVETVVRMARAFQSQAVLALIERTREQQA